MSPVDDQFPFVTVVISTRNRSQTIGRAVQSILNVDYPFFNLKVIDQSDDVSTREALHPFMADPHLHYIFSNAKGVSNGRNLGIRMARSELIALTDDDCVVPANWLHEIVKAFQAHAAIGIVLGNLLPGDFDAARGYLPVFVMEKPYLLTSSTGDIKNKLGWGACMALRQSVWEAIGGFDPLLGPGAPLKAGEDRDFSFRALSRGYSIFFSPEIGVVHHGVRKQGREGRELAYRDWSGAGAIVAKYLKCNQWKMVGDEFGLWLDIALKDFLRQSFFKLRPGGITPVVAFWLGLTRGLFTPVDSKFAIYKSNRPDTLTPVVDIKEVVSEIEISKIG